MAHKVAPLFLFSLPRAGSTFVQRVLGSHPSISTSAEPWWLLSFLYPFSGHQAWAEYGYPQLVNATADFVNTLQTGRADYFDSLREFVIDVYGKASKPDAVYFLDKTPRYHLIVNEVIELFPDAKIIFLWRQPLSVVSSMMDTWAKGRWNAYNFEVDLYKGMESLVNASRIHKEKCLTVRYEDLLINKGTWEDLFTYLGLEFNENYLATFADVQLAGRMGDPTGRKQYQAMANEPIEKWKKSFSNPIRKAWARKYINRIGVAMDMMGYDKHHILAELDALPTSYKGVFSDMIRMSYGQYKSRII